MKSSTLQQPQMGLFITFSTSSAFSVISLSTSAHAASIWEFKSSFSEVILNNTKRSYSSFFVRSTLQKCWKAKNKKQRQKTYYLIILWRKYITTDLIFLSCLKLINIKHDRIRSPSHLNPPIFPNFKLDVRHLTITSFYFISNEKFIENKTDPSTLEIEEHEKVCKAKLHSE